MLTLLPALRTRASSALEAGMRVAMVSTAVGSFNTDALIRCLQQQSTGELGLNKQGLDCTRALPYTDLHWPVCSGECDCQGRSSTATADVMYRHSKLIR